MRFKVRSQFSKYMKQTVLILLAALTFYAAEAQREMSTRKSQRIIRREARKLIEKGDQYFVLRNWDKAIEHGHMAMRMDSNNVQGYYLTGNGYIAKFDFVRAVNVFKVAERHFPNDSFVSLRLAQLWLQLNNPTEALQYYQQYQVLSPYSPAGYLGESVIRYQLNEKEESLKILEKGMSLSMFQSPYVVWFKGVLLYDMGDYKTARTTFLSLQKYRLSDPTINFYIGMCYYKEGTSLKWARKHLLRAQKRGVAIDNEVKQDLAI